MKSNQGKETQKIRWFFQKMKPCAMTQLSAITNAFTQLCLSEDLCSCYLNRK